MMSFKSYVLEDIKEALEQWCRRILYIETSFEKTSDLEECITNTLKRQIVDGLISHQDFAESHYTLNLWINLYKTILNNSGNKETVFYLLELFDLKLITKEFFLHIVTEVCLDEDVR